MWNVFESQYSAGSLPQLRLQPVFGPVLRMLMFPTRGHGPVGSVDPYVLHSCTVSSAAIFQLSEMTQHNSIVMDLLE